MAIVAQGVLGSNRDGQIRLVATKGAQNLGPTDGGAYIFVTANDAAGGIGSVTIGGTLKVTHRLDVLGGGVSLPQGSIGVNEIGVDAVGQSEIREGGVGIDQLTQALVGADNTGGPSNDSKGVRKLFGNGNSNGGSASDHTHGSGNTLDFDYMPLAIKMRVIEARRKVRALLNGELQFAQALERQRVMEKEIGVLALFAATVLMDAPDLTAEERTEMRRLGIISEDQHNEFFEHRLKWKIEAGSKRLHDKDDPEQSWVYDDATGGHPILMERL